MSKLRPRETLASAYIDRTQTAELHRAGLPCSLNQQRPPAGCQRLAVEADADLSSGFSGQKPEKAWDSQENPIPP